ncbi:DUF732 domain-containing protein [Mycobacterium bourgelatii]|uniref:DUF732 domain-containing protein n=1 Tax=Mycobacterium bourgelatii TaxID=1273442 RepID=A0A7I9YU48_MYCBU|nr:DUF732 domain-containing protein [Mycobacterium bourgelatii]MCV6977283.1 DUF732 domain-containing protein [Mycobacterium bourgelatii]GFG92126.1 hypothetical protein MBOU_41680 [Mycobacterium bourgelatii]
MLSARIAAAVIVGATAIGLAVAAAGTAGANTPADETFISQMQDVGVTFSSPQSAIQQGHQVCQELAEGRSRYQIAEEILSQTDLTTIQATSFVDNATDSYCPEFAALTV